TTSSARAWRSACGEPKRPPIGSSWSSAVGRSSATRRGCWATVCPSGCGGAAPKTHDAFGHGNPSGHRRDDSTSNLLEGRFARPYARGVKAMLRWGLGGSLVFGLGACMITTTGTTASDGADEGDDGSSA